MKTKDRIVDVAIRLFNEKFTKAVTTNHIAAAVGISPGNLYYHFSNKEEIIRAVFSRMVDFIEGGASYGSGCRVSPSLSSLEEFFQKVLALHWEYRFFFLELNSLLNSDRELKSSFNEMQKKRLKEIEVSIRAFIDAGILVWMEESTIEFLVKSMWIVSIFWLSFLETGDGEITLSRLEEGIDMMRNLLHPYLTGSPAGC